MEERYQKELFEDFDKPKKPFPKIDNIVPKTKFSLKLSLEKTVFVSIAIIMAMVIVYALGIEKGKAMRREGQAMASAAPAPAQKPQIAAQAPVPAPAPAPVQPEVQVSAQAAAQAKPYTVVVATFTRKEWAEKEIDRLRKKGVEAAIYQSGSYFLVCAGSYQTKDAAKEAMGKLRGTYKDAYLRSR